MGGDHPPESLHIAEAPQVDDVPGPKSLRLLDEQSQLESGAVAYPNQIPIAIEEAKGATIRDVDGNVFLDFFSGIGVVNVGHSNPYVLQGVHEQVESLVHTLDFPSQPRIDLMRALDEIAPDTLSGNNRILFGGPTGSDAIEATIKLAKAKTGGSGLVAFRGGYHGGTTGALSLSSQKSWKAQYAPLLPDVVHVPYPYPLRQGKSPEEAVEYALEEARATISDPSGGIANLAGIWVEPVLGTGGVVVPPDGFLSGLEEIAQENDIPLIIDEIQTGMGRTGQWFASDWYDVSPDAVTMAKAVGGIGLPLSATIYDESLDVWDGGGHSGTFKGHVPAMCAGLRAIEYIQQYDLLQRARDVGDYLKQRLHTVAQRSPFVRDIRGKGLLIGVEFLTEDERPFTEFKQRVREYCFQNGLIVWSAGIDGNVLRLLPPLVVTDRQAEVGANIIVDAIDRATREFQE